MLVVLNVLLVAQNRTLRGGLLAAERRTLPTYGDRLEGLREMTFAGSGLAGDDGSLRLVLFLNPACTACAEQAVRWRRFFRGEPGAASRAVVVGLSNDTVDELRQYVASIALDPDVVPIIQVSSDEADRHKLRVTPLTLLVSGAGLIVQDVWPGVWTPAVEEVIRMHVRQP